MDKEMIVDKLEERLVHMEYPSMYHLKEREICDEFKVSRIPAREVLHLLEAKGLLHKEKSMGFYVKHPSVEEVKDLYDARFILESAALYTIFDNSDTHKVFLKQALDFWKKQSKASNEIESDAAIKNDIDFHVNLVLCIRNQYLISIYKELNKKLTMFRKLEFENHDAWQHTCKEHIAILKACIENDKDSALKALKRNINSALERIEKILTIILRKQ